MRKLLGTAGVTLLLAIGGAGLANASQAHPSPDSSCSKPGTHATYYTPKLHHRDLLTCERFYSGKHYKDEWKITGH